MLDLADADASDVDGTSLTPLLEGRQPDGDGLAIAEYEAHGTDRPGRMVRRGRWKLNYYYREPSELFDLESDPNELNDLAADPAHAAVREVMTAIALDGWDPAEIDRRVRESQRKRRILVAGDPGPASHEWDPETVGMAVGPAESR
jgi:choline-sulfatase